MKTALFKQIRTQVIQLTKLYSPNDKFIAVEIETLEMAKRTFRYGSRGTRQRDPQLLTRPQLEYFEYLNNFTNTKGVNL